MSSFKCTRCGSTEPMTESPVPGKLGQTMLSHTCANCWHEWDELQIKLINENRLNLAVMQHYEMLVGEMRKFLLWPA